MEAIKLYHHTNGSSIKRRSHNTSGVIPLHPSATQQSDLAAMVPKPYDDLFIEPAGEADVQYGDYNSTMDDGSPTSKRPYIRLTAALPNITRPLGGEIRLKCEAASSLPITFTWLKNLAPIEKNRKTKVRHKEYWSKLVIQDLDVLDSGYYQCTAANSAGSVNTTSVLRVNPSAVAQGSSSSVTGNGLSSRGKSAASSIKDKLSSSSKKSANLQEDYDSYDVNNYLEAEMRPSEEDFTLHVPNSAAGTGYVGINSDRWLDGRTVKKGECVLYQGESCRAYLAGKHVKITSDSREDMYDVDRNLRAAMLFINNMPNVADKCKNYSHAVACYHQFKVCDTPSVSNYYGNSPSTSANSSVVSICRKDCDDLKDKECPNELAIAAQHELVGDGPKALLPNCETLSSDAAKCFRVLDPAPSATQQEGFGSKSDGLPNSHWCFVDSGSQYEGTASTTKSNRQCLPWSQSTSSQFNTIVYPRLKHAKNQCRNPGGQRSEPWCYTLPTLNQQSYSSLNFVEESCGLKRCPPNLYPEWGDGHKHPSPTPEATPPLLESLANVWKSLSSQWQLAAVSGIGGLLLLLLLLCCACCCRKKSKQRRKHSSANPALNSATNIIHNNESASSMISSNIKKTNLALQSCNGGSSVTNSDVNSAYFRKIRDEAARMHGGEDDSLNPLLKFNIQPHQQLSQKQMFELQQQHQHQKYWMGEGYASGSLQYPPSHQFSQQQHVYPLQSYNHSSPHTSTEPPAEPYQIPTIQEQQLKFDKIIGEDAATIVYLGEWVGGMISGATLQVAIKTPKPGASLIAVENFREEIKEVGPFEHINVVRMFGVAYLGQQISAVFDFMIHGDLHEFLRVREPRGTENDEKERLRNAEDFLRICTQICAGMEYMANNSYVHRDLAARNCLVGDQQIIKIADFGRMKSCYDHNYYKLNVNSRVPLRWMSKEALNEAKYSQASDIYSFGVTLWEMYTYARQPYEGITNAQVVEMINDEVPLELPAYCPTIVYGVMIECWHVNPKRRPTFSELHNRFQKWVGSGGQALGHHHHRASSVHSGGSSGGSGAIQRGTGRPQLAGGLRGSMGLLDQQQPFGCSVPSPAPNSTTNLSANTNGSGQIAKLTMLSNGNSIVHSTPIDARTQQQKAVKNGGESQLIKDGLKKNGIKSMKSGESSSYLAGYTDEDYSSEDDSC